jgi:glycosyltransferase involved in cell wall biosynthesis
MNLFYFVHVTGTDTGISGIPRVVKNLGRELVSMPGLRVIPASWSKDREALVHTEQKLLDNLALYGGPVLTAASEACKPIEPAAGDWLLVPEAPHLASHDADYPSLLIDRLIGFARSAGLRVAVVLHDIMPLTHRFGCNRRRAFADMVSEPDRSDDGERQRLRFAIFAHALALVDLVLPVSRTSGDLLAAWLVQQGHDAKRLPPITPVLLPEEVQATSRVVPHRSRRRDDGPIEFLTVGTVCTHKNQLAAMAAFQRLIDRRPDLDIRLNVVGTVAPDVSVAASQLAKWSKGRIVLHGHLPDDRLDEMRDSSRATVFISLAEGYGLPVAESLWRGKPCLCSNEGSIAEIAAGGGCFPVNPRNLDEIGKGLETLATNAERYDGLLQEIAARRFRSWREYAREIVDRLTASAEGRLQTSPPSDVAREPIHGADGPRSAMLTLSSADLVVPSVYTADRERPIRYHGAIRFEREADGDIQEDVLFYGPYVWLPAGRYAFTLDGEIGGELDIALTAAQGQQRIAWIPLTSFADPIVIDLPGPVDNFEIVGYRTPSLERLVLRGAMVEYQGGAPATTETRAPERPREKTGKPGAFADRPMSAPASPASVCGRDDDGRPVRFPCTIPAERMRVHEAYGAGARNLLRAGSAIAFRIKDHSRVAEDTLFFGPYFSLEPGHYTIRIDGELQGRLRLRLTQKFASETLVEMVVSSFEEPIRLKLTSPAEKFEVVGDRLGDTRSVTLRAIQIAREPTSQGHSFDPDSSIRVSRQGRTGESEASADGGLPQPPSGLAIAKANIAGTAA